VKGDLPQEIHAELVRHFGAAAVSTNAIDLGDVTPKRDIGTGEPLGFGFVVTTAGNLPASYVIHAAVMGPDLKSTPDVVRRATQSVLRRAEELRLQSLAFPAFGTGVGRMAPKESADAMVGALRTHLAEMSPSNLRRVHLVLFQDDIHAAFGEALGRSGARRVR